MIHVCTMNCSGGNPPGVDCEHCERVKPIKGPAKLVIPEIDVDGWDEEDEEASK